MSEALSRSPECIKQQDTGPNSEEEHRPSSFEIEPTTNRVRRYWERFGGLERPLYSYDQKHYAANQCERGTLLKRIGFEASCDFRRDSSKHLSLSASIAFLGDSRPASHFRTSIPM
jgi:hypothetical protein